MVNFTELQLSNKVRIVLGIGMFNQFEVLKRKSLNQ